MASQLDRIESRLTKMEASLATLAGGPKGTAAAESDLPPFQQNVVQPPVRGEPPWNNETEDHFQARVKRHENLQRWQQQFDDAFWPGKFGVETLTPQDMIYIDEVQPRYFQKTGKDIMRDGLIGGKNVHLNAVRRDGPALRGQYDMSNYDSPLKREIERRLAA
jgi:hypothetical protein